MNDATLAAQSFDTTDIAVPDLSSRTVVLLAGGRSSEREVSLWTAKGVDDALRGKLATPHAAKLPRCIGTIEVELDGSWKFQSQSRSPSETLRALGHVDVVFTCLHGGDGEDGTVQGFLATSGERCTGSGVRASALCIDKQATRALAHALDIRTAAGLCFSAHEFECDRRGWLERVDRLSSDGWVVKPRCGGSSVATRVTRERHELEFAIEAALATGDDVVVEARIAGVELSCGVLGNRGGALRALPPIEIRPADGRFFDYEQKYSAGGAREVCPPVSVGAASVARVQECARAIHRRAGCDGYSRVDFIVPVAGAVDGEPVMLEVNTLPGMTTRSLLPQEAQVLGLDYTGLCLVILDLALQQRPPQ